MIPVQLSLRNFMSYGEPAQVLNFRGLHVVCLSGDNGNGKSALLDAVTFALWDSTRGSGTQSVSKNDLVRLGAEEAEVVLDFEVDGDLYRTVHRRNRRTDTTDWQLYRYSEGQAQPWMTVGGQKREVEQRLRALLRLDCHTFENSAYLRQGRADEFVRQPSARRKEVLAGILNLAQYDDLSERAKAHRDQCREALKLLDNRIQILSEEAGRQEALAKTLSLLKENLAEAVSARDAARDELDTLKQKLAAYQQLQSELRNVREDESRARDLEQRSLLEHQRLTREIEAVQNLRREEPALQQSSERLQTVRGELRVLAPMLDQLHTAEQERSRLLQAIRDKAGLLERTIAELKGSIAVKQSAAARAETLRSDLESVRMALHELADCTARREACAAQLAGKAEAVQRMKVEGRALKVQIAENEEAEAVLAAASNECPTCGSDLSGDRRAAVLARLQNRTADWRAKLAVLRQAVLAAEAEETALRTELQQLEDADRRRQLLKARLQDLEAALKTAEAESEGLAEQLLKLERQQRRLEAEEFGAEERSALISLETQLQEGEDLRRKAAELRKEQEALERNRVETRLIELRSALERLPEMQRRRASAAEENAQHRAEAEALRMEADTLSARADADAHLPRSVEISAEKLKNAETAASRSEREAAIAEERLQRAQHAAEQIARLKTERLELDRERADWEELTKAFGRNGIQSMIIENALPEIQDEANRLLSRMTENGLQVALTVHRRSTRDELEISITDDLGTRPYELYSGGEAFRVSFALRIALSRLLARRAGAALQALFIDEGFGTQDAKGREKLVEAIESVRDEFRLILVITHFEDLKDAFPVRIEVVKGPNGSRFVETD
jgi:exonuclease SbcC